MTKEYFSQFLKENLPIADIAGITLKEFSDASSQVQVSLSFITQNPFKSMFWAVQGMAAELSTGVLCIDKIAKSTKNISMLVIRQEADFTKKATGKITFTCKQGQEIDRALQKAIETKEGQVVIVESEGRDEEGDVVAIFRFTWSFKVRE
ncbi:MAG: DUF4442 domain-containing protein [Flavobacteriaceae bacterium]|jgi:hypothetical protein|nr:DUF4442 domain-containing protein [Flavobacteriaceae bacterium]